MDRVVQFIDETMDSMLAQPRFWGSHRSVESQVMRLLEVRAVTLAPSASVSIAGEIEQNYVRFLRRALPGSPETTLFTRVKENADDFQRLLRQFVDETQKAQGKDLVSVGATKGGVARFRELFLDASQDGPIRTLPRAPEAA